MNEETAVHLGENAEFEGDLKFYGTARIEGRVKGNITGEGTLELGKTSKIEADIHASHIIIQGEIRGNIFAEEKIEIKAASKVFGNIEAPVLTLEAGAAFQGNCQTRLPKVAGKDELEVKPGKIR